MSALTLRPSRVSAVDTPFGSGAYVVLSTDRRVTVKGITHLRVPDRVFVESDNTIEVLPNSACDDPEFNYVLTVFAGDGSVSWQNRFVMPATDAVLYDLIAAPVDLDAAGYVSPSTDPAE